MEGDMIAGINYCRGKYYRWLKIYFQGINSFASSINMLGIYRIHGHMSQKGQFQCVGDGGETQEAIKKMIIFRYIQTYHGVP